MTHARLMDRVYRRQRHFYDCTRKYYLFGRDRMIAELGLKPGERLVEVGCGTARNLIKIANAYPATKLYGLDASSEMLKTAERAIMRAGLAERVTLRHGYAEALAPELFGEVALFDVALFSYSLSMIPNWRTALSAAAAALAPTGTARIVDFGDFTGLPRLARQLLRGWLALFHVLPRPEVVAALAEASIRGCTLEMLAGRYAFRLVLTKQALDGLFAPVALSPQISTKSR